MLSPLMQKFANSYNGNSYNNKEWAGKSQMSKSWNFWHDTQTGITKKQGRIKIQIK